MNNQNDLPDQPALNIENQNRIDKNYAKNSDLENNQQDVTRRQKEYKDNEIPGVGESQKRISVEVRKDSIIGRVISDGANAGVQNSNNGEIQKNDNAMNQPDLDINGPGQDPNANSGRNTYNRDTSVNDKGEFDVANLPKAQENVNQINGDLFDKKDDTDGSKTGGIPNHVHIIESDAEKNQVDTDNNNERRGENPVDNSVVRLPSIETNEIPRNIGVDANRGQQNVVQPQTVEDEKPGSLKVVWDWSDFAVNFEQYVMPEQKIRRAPHATTGEPWPMPQYYVTKKDKVYKIDRASFRFDLSKIKCDIIEKAIERYKPYVLEDPVEDMYDNFQNAQSTMFEEPSIKYDKLPFLNAPSIPRVLVKIRKPCDKFPSAKSDESCKSTLLCSNFILEK